MIAVQSVNEHCRNTARYAAQALEPVSLSAAGYLAGLVHDAGKYTAAFQDYLINQAGRRGSVNHTFTGVRLLLERYFHADADDERYDQETAFYCGLLARLLLSAVIEGDRRDTAEFDGAQFPERRDAEALQEQWSACLDRVEAKLDKLPRSSPVDRARRAISDQCRRAAEQPGGVYRLNVPTGGGKTLSSLRFAAAHAKRHGKQRVIFTSPLLSILEQNAKVLRDYIQDDSLILEHHSNLVRTDETPEALDRRELLTETWASPIVITTLVQLLNTLFSGKTTAVRRFHALCGSVIIIDEVQTVPSKLLSLFSLAVNFLAEVCGATVVLCSATQPYMERIQHPLHVPIPDLVPYDPRLWAVFRRTDLQNAGSMSLEEIARFALERLEEADSLLLVCNKKDQSEKLFGLLEGGEFALFHLSAAMCVQHRRDTLEGLRASLERGRKTVCVSTQVIEAGVDVSFSQVIRLTAGMDSVVQAAGRCNRGGEAGPGVPELSVRPPAGHRGGGGAEHLQRGQHPGDQRHADTKGVS